MRRLYQALSQVFIARNCKNLLKNDKLTGIVDPANVCAIIPKNELFGRWLNKNFEGERAKPINPVHFKRLKPSRLSRASFSIEYFKKIIDIIDATDEYSIQLVVGKDYPLRIDTEDFYIYLAPRIGGDEE